MTTDWIFLIPSTVYSRILSEFSPTVKKKYNMTDDNFSTAARSYSDTKFPFVYIQTLPASERGQDLEGQTINGGFFAFQIEVTDNKSDNRAREVMKEVVRIMKTMRFQSNEMPSFESTEDEHKCVARFQRVIGYDDKL